MKPTPTLALAALLVTHLAILQAAEPGSVPRSPTDFQITLGGEVGVAAEANMARFRSSPFDSVPWLRADLTGEKRWDELVQGGFINPAGGILEKCQVADGGFGQRTILCDKDGVRGFGRNILESTWCCDYHGQLGFVNLRSHLLERDAAGLTCNLALEFTAKGPAGTVKSTLSAGASAGEVMRRQIQLNGLPAWPTTVEVLKAQGLEPFSSALRSKDFRFVFDGKPVG